MRRLLQLGAWLLVLAAFVTPISEYFDRWDAAGLGSDTEFAVFVLIFVLCLVLVVCRLLSSLAVLAYSRCVGYVRDAGELLHEAGPVCSNGMTLGPAPPLRI